MESEERRSSLEVTHPPGPQPQLPDTRVVEAPAKLNPVLRVLGRRDDGYHDIETVILPISLADRIEVHAYSGPGEFRTLSLSLDVSGDPALIRAVPRDETNLVLRAAAALARHQGITGFAEIVLDKRVPAAAGLGGGSADAAATLHALNDLWGCGLSADELRGIGAGVGSDVPALVTGGPVLARGRGELVERISMPPFRWSLVTFPFGVRTSESFGWWDEDGGPTGPDPARLLAAAGEDVNAVGRLLSNDLEEPMLRRHPEVREARDRLLSEGAAGVVMCGSGPTLAALMPEDRSIQAGSGMDVTSAEGIE
jgi:4-diphosphocytidyl-2-C-methyl-D-erythritol kinase